MQLKYGTPYLTTYDLVKSLAVLLMLLDHVGYFFYPENDWFRVAGRGALPIWAFLIGYATTRELSKSLLGWAGVLLVVNVVTGGPFLPLNVLFTFIGIRMIIDRTARFVFGGWEVMIYSVIAMCVFFVPTTYASEYGTGALMIALCGLMMRHSGQLPVSKRAQNGFFIFVAIFHALSQNILFSFGILESKASAFLIGGVMVMMYFFKPLELIKATEKTPRPITGMLQFAGRYTLEIYAIHMIIFKLIAAQYHLEGYGFFDFKLLPP